MSIAKLAAPDAPTIHEANKIVRGNWLRAVQDHCQQYSGNSEINDILDIGCSVGVSTRYLAEMFPSANIIVSSFHMTSSTCLRLWTSVMVYLKTFSHR